MSNESKIERKICILTCDISNDIQEKLNNGTLDFETDVTLNNLFVEVDFQDKTGTKNPQVIDVISSKKNKNLYLGIVKSKFTIIQVSFFMIEESNRPYLITRGNSHVVTKGLSVLHNLSNLVIDDDINTVENMITNVIDKMIYIDHNKSYFGGNGFISFFKRNRLKYIIHSYGIGFNNPGINKANYIFFTYNVLVENEKPLRYKNQREFLLYDKKDGKIFQDTFKVAPKTFEEGFKKWYESLNTSKIKCKFCFEGAYDITLLKSYIYGKKKTKFKKAFFIQKENIEKKEYISKYENLIARMRATVIKSIQDNSIKAFKEAPQKIIYGMYSGILATFLVVLIDTNFYFKIAMYIVTSIFLVPLTKVTVDILYTFYKFFIIDNNK